MSFKNHAELDKLNKCLGLDGVSISSCQFSHGRLSKDFYDLCMLCEDQPLLSAKSKTDENHYVIKIILLEDDRSENVVNGEVKTISNLEHPNVVRYYDSWIENGTYGKPLSQEEVAKMQKLPKLLFIKMEYCKGKTLREYMDSNELYKNASLIWIYFHDMLKALEYIHSKGIIHRDIKPQNIFLSETSTGKCIKIGDFGISIFDQNFGKKAAKTYQGTGQYMAPEVRAAKTSKEPYDFKCDVFSLGIVLFEMFYHPLKIEEEYDFYKFRFSSNGIEFPSDFGEILSHPHKLQVQELIQWMLTYNPDYRPAIEELLKSELVTCVEMNENDYHKQFSKIIKNPTTKFRRFILNELFTHTSENCPRKDSTCSNDAFVNPLYQKCISDITNLLKIVFVRHGMRELPSHFFTSSGGLLSPQPKKLDYSVINQDGKKFALTNDLHQSFASFYAMYGNLRCYTFGKIITKKFEESSICAIDFTAPKECCSNIAGNMLFLINDLKNDLPFLSHLRCIIRIGHVNFIKAVCKYFNCNESIEKQTETVLYAMHSISEKIPFQECIIRLKTAADIEYKKSQDILTALKPVGSLEEFAAKMNLANPDIMALVSDAVTEIKKAVEQFKLFSRQKNVSIIYDPGLCYQPEVFADGLLYTLEIEDSSKREIVLAGGRFDTFFDLHRKVQEDQDETFLCAYGCNISIKTLYFNFKKLEISNYVPQVLIYSESNENAANVWGYFRDVNYPASIYYGHDVTTPKLLKHCETQKIPFLLVYTDEEHVNIYKNINLTNASQLANYDEKYYLITLKLREAIISIVNSVDE